MKKVFLAIIACAMLFLTACEKHDGIDYFKSKCIAELNGQKYIDQTPFSISPNVIITPELNYSEKELSFMTLLRSERNCEIALTVRINLYCEDSGEMLKNEQTIEKVDFQPSGGENYKWEYIKYCKDNKISYARVNDEIVNNGTFKITSYNVEKHQYTGSFTLQFSEGTLKGDFEI